MGEKKKESGEIAAKGKEVLEKAIEKISVSQDEIFEKKVAAEKRRNKILIIADIIAFAICLVGAFMYAFGKGTVLKCGWMIGMVSGIVCAVISIVLGKIYNPKKKSSDEGESKQSRKKSRNTAKEYSLDPIINEQYKRKKPNAVAIVLFTLFIIVAAVLFFCFISMAYSEILALKIVGIIFSVLTGIILMLGLLFAFSVWG